MHNRFARFLTGLMLTASIGAHSAWAAQDSASLKEVASFDHQVTGVAVSKDGRIFVNFPRWTEDSAISVAEVKATGIVAFPDAEWNKWRNSAKDKISSGDHFVCVQSVVMDHHNHLWVVDPAAPANDRIVPGGPKLVRINLGNNKVDKIIAFDEKAAPTGTYLNDVRFSPDDKHAYLTDSGNGALLVADIEKGVVRRVLEKDVTVLAEKGLHVHADGKELRRPDGRAPEFNSDGIALSADGSTLYWQALSGSTLYSLPAAALNNDSLSSDALKAKIVEAGQNGPADGLWIDEKNRMYVSSPEENAVKIRRDGSRPQILVQDSRLRWPDSFAEGPDGSIYVTGSHIQDSPWFKPGADPAVKTELWQIVPVDASARGGN